MSPPRSALLAVAALLAGCSGGAATSPSAVASARATATAAATVAATATPTPATTPTGPPAGLDPAQMYSGAAPDLSAYDPATLRSVVVTGDVLPVRLVNHTLKRTGDFAAPLAPVQALLHSGDVTFMNVEAPLLASCPDTTTGFTLCGDSRFVAPLVGSGNATVANLASNHITNYGTSGLRETEQRLTSAGAAYSGDGHVAVRSIRGLRIAFVGLSGVGNRVDQTALQVLIHEARAQADVVIVQFHWGKEYETYPFSTPVIAPDDPRVIGRLAIDDGADLVIGNHPHCVQGSEVYKGKLIAYAHGNFIFDQDWSTGTMEGVVGVYTFSGTALVAVRYVPTRITDTTWVVRPLDPSTGEGQAILARMLRSTEELAGTRTPIHRPDLSDGQNACT